MTKKIIVAAVVLLVGAWVVKKTQVCSYATAVFKSGAEQVRSRIPRELELSRVKNEISQMDREYQKLLRVIAERMASTKKLTAEVAVAEANRKEMADSLLALSDAIEAKETPIAYKGINYSTTAKAEGKAARELTLLKQLDKSLASKKKVLEAEQRNLDALKDRLDKLVSQKREFEVCVAQLEANQAEIDAQHTMSPPKADDTLVADIKNSLDRLRFDMEVDMNLMQIESQYGSKIDSSTAGTPQTQSVNVQDIRNYVQNPSSAKQTKVAQSK
jgi:chromosome segregation ATPase